MRANELKVNDVIAINYGTMNPDRYVLITSEVIPGVESIAGNALGHGMDDNMPVVIADDSDSRSVNGSPIGSWKKLDDKYAAALIEEAEFFNA